MEDSIGMTARFTRHAPRRPANPQRRRRLIVPVAVSDLKLARSLHYCSSQYRSPSQPSSATSCESAPDGAYKENEHSLALWWWVIVILFPIPSFSPWWLGIIGSMAIVLLIDCIKASPFHFNSAGIVSPHQFKTDYGAVPNSKFEICACKDGSIIIKPTGTCGQPGAGIPTGSRWK